MKNFFKKLAFVMALAMVITSLAPAAGVFAAAKPALNAKSKTLLLGNKGRNTFDFNLNNKVKGSTYKWTTSNKKVVTVAQNGLVKAVGNGTATIKLAITLPTKKVTNLSATVVVKTNATSVEITNLPEGAIKVGTTHNFNRSYKMLAGGVKTTDVTTFVITSENAAKAKITKSGFFTATEAGEYTIQALMAQSASKLKAGVYTAKSEEVKVVVKASIASVAQVDATTFKVTFDSPVTGELKDFSLAEVIGTAKVTKAIKAVKFDDTKKVATVTAYVPFNGGSTHVVSYTEMDSVEFVAATTKIEDVATIDIVNKQITYNVPKDLEVKLYNKDGVDITTTELLNMVTLQMSADGLSKANLNGKTLIIFNKNDSVVVTATFHTYKYDGTTGKEIGQIEAVVAITGVDKEDITLSGNVEYTIIGKTDTADFDKVNTKIAAEDPSQQLVIRIKNSKNEYVRSDSDSKFTFESSNNSILIADTDGTLHPVKAGVVVVVVKYDGKAVGTVNIVVSEKRVEASLTFDTNVVTLSNSLNVNDSKVVTATVKDQLGNDINKTVTIEKLANSPATEIATIVGNKITFNGVVNGLSAAKGNYQYKVTAGNQTRVIGVTILEPTDAIAKTFALEVSTRELDLKVKTGDVSKDVKIDLFGLASNGVKTSKEAVTGGNFLVEVKFQDGTLITTADTFNGTTAVSGGAITKVKTGTYYVTAYEIDTVKNTKVAVANTNFKVDDTQAKPVLTEVKSITSNAGSIAAAIKECLVVKLNGVDKSSELVIGEISGTDAPGNYVYVRTVKLYESIGTSTLEHTITVNQYITLK